MKEIIYTIPQTIKEKQIYLNLIQDAISNIDEAISHITYRSNLIDIDTNKSINSDLIDSLNEIIYKLEDYQDADVFKPYVK